jgi:DNA-binding transcriptional ArsR family regulator
MPSKKFLELTEPSVIRAVSHPARVAILAYLGDGPATATECSEAAGVSPSACSYHLRTLARVGFLEETPSDDGRERRWRLKVGGHGIPKSAQDRPEVMAAARLWGRRWIAMDQRILAGYLATEARQPRAWQKAATFSSMEVHLTPDELIELGERFNKMLEPYSRRTESKKRPEGTRPVHFTLTAFPRSEDPAQRRRAMALTRTRKRERDH